MKRLTAFMAALVLICTASAQENEIRRIPQYSNDTEQNDYSTYESGFWMAAEALGGVSCHFSGSNLGLAEADVTAGYRFNQYIKVGAGIGARYYINQGHMRRTSIKWGMPLFVTARGNFISSTYRTCVPYWGVEVGGSIRDGFMWRPTLGLRFGEPRGAFTLGLSYMGQDLATLNNKGEKTTKYTNFICLRLGYEF